MHAREGSYHGPMHRIFTTSVASVYPHYVAKVEKKGRTKSELDETIEWLTGYDDAELRHHLDAGTTFEDFFAGAHLNPNASLITGSVCGVKVFALTGLDVVIPLHATLDEALA